MAERARSARMAIFDAIVAAAIILACGLAVASIARPQSVEPARLVTIPAREIVLRLPVTLELLIGSMIVSLAFSLTLACVASKAGSRTIKRSIQALATVLESVPFFWLVLFVSVLAAIRFGDSIFGWAASSRFSLTDHLAHLVLPACIAALAQIPIVVRAPGFADAKPGGKFDVITQPYRAASALAERLPEVIAACLVTELVFAWPGEGRFLFRALNADQAGLAMAVVVLFGWLALFFRAVVRRPKLAFWQVKAEMRKRQIGVAAFAIVVVTAVGIFSGVLQSYANTIDNMHWEGRPLPPCFVDASACGGHVLGTDDVGRDLLARLIVGARASLGMSLAAVIVEVVILALLFLGNQRGGAAVRYAVARCTDAVACFAAWPFIAVVAVITFNEPPIVRLAVVSLVAGALLAARTMLMIAERRCSTSLVRQAARDWPTMLLMLATIDFFGLGVAPPTPSWGNMLVDAQSNLEIAWWAAVFPAACLFVAALSMELAGLLMRNRA